ncbi:MAG: 16S rRNA (guanine(527)-N(7))-methyltransferase RsmG [Halanaerobiaceae bacterium]
MCKVLREYSRDNFKGRLSSALKSIDLGAEEWLLDRCCDYYEFLIRENDKYNLTTITDPDEVVYKHFLDSLAPLTVVSLPEVGKFLDIGSGAGFPGMVLKLFFPEPEFVLLDARKKRVNFLKLLAARLGIASGLEIIHSRAEEVGSQKEHRGRYDIVLARAVAPINVLVEYSLPLAICGGLILFYKGPEVKAELEEASAALLELGGRLEAIHEINIPGLEAKRRLVVLRKSGETPRKYPRRPGIPKKRPL